MTKHRGWWSAGLLGALIAAFLALPTTLQAQSATTSILEKYDLDRPDANMIYCRMPDVPVQGLGTIVTAGSNATVTAGTGTPFAGLAENDVLYALSPATGAVETRYIITWTSNTQVTVDAAVDWSTAQNFSYKHVACGTTANDGWFDMAPYNYASIIVNVAQLNVTGGINFRWECRASAPQAAPVQVCPTTINTFRNVTVAGITDGAINCAVEEPYAQCRVGMAIATSDDGGDLTTNREQISIQVDRRMSGPR